MNYVFGDEDSTVGVILCELPVGHCDNPYRDTVLSSYRIVLRGKICQRQYRYEENATLDASKLIEKLDAREINRQRRASNVTMMKNPLFGAF